MNNEPVLATRIIPGNLGTACSLKFTVYGGLHHIKGNHAPYFSLTYWEHRKGFPNQCQSGGAGHERILEYYPQFADLAALHLSDIDGVPMHAESNGWYNLAGALPDNAGEIRQQEPRWKQEADACIARHGLVVYGDPWPIAAEVVA